MSENFYQERIKQITKAQMELKIRLELVSKMKIECAKTQLELLKLYNPRCLEILESLEDITEPPIAENDGDVCQSTR